VPGLNRPYGREINGTSNATQRMGGSERGQGAVEWVGVLATVALLLVALLAVGVRVPGASLARAVGAKLLCAAALAEHCGDEPGLIAAYGSEVGELVREHMPALLFERGSRALPVDFRRCRASGCGDGSARGLVHRTDAGLPVTAFVRVIDCREVDEGESSAGGGSSDEFSAARLGDPSLPPDCSGQRVGNLYIQYWTYYADSATLRGVPVAGPAGYHRDDWESVQIRIGPDGQVDQRASSHHGYNDRRSVANWGSDAGLAPLRDIAEALGARPRNGWGRASGALLVSGGSHAGNNDGFPRIDRATPGRRVHLVPLEPIAAGEGEGHRFAVSPPWRKRVWRDPEAVETG
jgi:hypothetical protein